MGLVRNHQQKARHLITPPIYPSIHPSIHPSLLVWTSHLFSFSFYRLTTSQIGRQRSRSGHTDTQNFSADMLGIDWFDPTYRTSDQHSLSTNPTSSSLTRQGRSRLLGFTWVNAGWRPWSIHYSWTDSSGSLALHEVSSLGYFSGYRCWLERLIRTPDERMEFLLADGGEERVVFIYCIVTEVRSPHLMTGNHTCAPA